MENLTLAQRAEVVEGAIEIIRDPEHWTQKAFLRSKKDRKLYLEQVVEGCAVSFCSRAAIMRVAVTDGHIIATDLHVGCDRNFCDDFRRILKLDKLDIADWNDNSTHEEVLEGLKKVAKQLRKEAV